MVKCDGVEESIGYRSLNCSFHLILKYFYKLAPPHKGKYHYDLLDKLSAYAANFLLL